MGSEAILDKVDIAAGLHVQMPAWTLHGMVAGDEGCEFIWTFAASKWKDIPYLYVDQDLPHRNFNWPLLNKETAPSKMATKTTKAKTAGKFKRRNHKANRASTRTKPANKET